jgi:hypothetical protein
MLLYVRRIYRLKTQAERYATKRYETQTFLWT